MHKFQKRPAYLIALDFDGNVARTFEKGPRGIGVNESNLLAIKEIFPTLSDGIFSPDPSMAPTEIIDSILKIDSNGELRESVRSFFDSESANLREFVPQGKGYPLVWNSDEIAKIATELFVRAKLRYSVSQIGEVGKDGTSWPRECEGFFTFWEAVNQLGDSGEVDLTTAVVSSGHEAFIRKTFELWGVPQPDILVTEDDMRMNELPRRTDLRIKPGPLPMHIAYREWRKMERFMDEGVIYAPIVDSDRMMMCGDDLKRDGGLAEAAGILFGHYVEGQQGTKLNGKRIITFGDWTDMGTLIAEHFDLLVQGRPFSEIFLRASVNKETITRRKVEAL